MEVELWKNKKESFEYQRLSFAFLKNLTANKKTFTENCTTHGSDGVKVRCNEVEV